jgi:hypothetical protein
LRKIIKILTSGDLIDILDANNDGKIQWKEIKNSPLSSWIEIAYKYIPVTLEYLYHHYF